MARNYGRFTTSIYRDAEFRALTFEQQGVYFMLGLQAEVSAAGTLPLRMRRWAQLADGGSVESLRLVLDVLAEIGHVLFDEDTEELLITKFVKWDGGWQNSKRLPVVREAALGVESPLLRTLLAAELLRLGLSDMASELSPDSASPTASDRASDTRSASDRVVVTEVVQLPQPLILNPESATLAPVEPTSAQTIVGEWIERSAKRPPSQVVGQIAKLVASMLAEGIDPDDVRRGLAAWMAKSLHPSALPSVVNEVMNAAPTLVQRRSTTDQRVQEGRDLAARLRAEERRELPA